LRFRLSEGKYNSSLGGNQTLVGKITVFFLNWVWTID